MDTLDIGTVYGPTLVSFSELDLAALWAGFTENTSSGIDVFKYALCAMVTPESAWWVDDIELCSRCDEITSDSYGTAEDGSVCESCIEDYWTCARCDEYYRSTTTTLNDDEVCEGCLENGYSYCETCGGYYQYGYEDHDHEPEDESAGCCESPAQVFTIRNDGDAPLANDERVTIELPAGVISDEGLGAIASLLREDARVIYFNSSPDDEDRDRYQKWYGLGSRLSELGPEWQTKQGNFTKRLSRFAYKEYAIKLSPEILSTVGNIARDHSKAVAVHLETTRDLNQSAEDFYHDDSCWWQSYSSSRCALKTNGGFGLRTFADDGTYIGSRVTGRAWVMPLRKDDDSATLVPTFYTMTPDAFVVFNGYGDLGGYAPARILAHMAGWTYRKIGLSAAPMYINSGGYLVAPEEIASNWTTGAHLTLSTPQHANLFESEGRTTPCLVQ